MYKILISIMLASVFMTGNAFADSQIKSAMSNDPDRKQAIKYMPISNA